jgi:hypothetical protein
VRSLKGRAEGLCSKRGSQRTALHADDTFPMVMEKVRDLSLETVGIPQTPL